MNDFFICHASEDKDSFVRPLAERLIKEGYQVWYDEYTLTIGDRLRRKIEEGLTNSKYGIVILSRNFFNKEWPKNELDGLFSLEIEREEILKYSPILADRLAAKSKDGLDKIINLIKELFKSNIDKYIQHLREAIDPNNIRLIINEIKETGIQPDDTIFSTIIYKIVSYIEIDKYFKKQNILNAPISKLRWHPYPEKDLYLYSVIEELTSKIIFSGEKISNDGFILYFDYKPLEVGAWYVVSCIAKSDKDTNAKLKLWCHDKTSPETPGREQVSTAVSTPINNKETFFLFFKSKINSEIRIHLQYLPGKGRIEVNDVKIEKLII